MESLKDFLINSGLKKAFSITGKKIFVMLGFWLALFNIGLIFPLSAISVYSGNRILPEYTIEQFFDFRQVIMSVFAFVLFSLLMSTFNSFFEKVNPYRKQKVWLSHKEFQERLCDEGCNLFGNIGSILIISGIKNILVSSDFNFVFYGLFYWGVALLIEWLSKPIEQEKSIKLEKKVINQ